MTTTATTAVTAAPERHDPGDTRLRDYLLAAFGLTWALWVPAGLALRGAIELPVAPTGLLIVGAFGPMAAALLVAARDGGRRGVKALLGQLRFRGVARRWFAMALLLGAVTAVPALVYLAIGGETDLRSVGAHLAVMPLHFLIVATFGGGLDEEVGWRGMAQPLLQRRMPPLAANAVLGVIWAVWHLPLWLDPHSAQAAYPFAVYLLELVGLSLITGYLYNASGGSLLIAVVVHSANNTFDGLRYAVLGDAGGELTWQLVLAAASLGLGAAVAIRTRGHLGFAEDAGASASQGADTERPFTYGLTSGSPSTSR